MNYKKFLIFLFILSLIVIAVLSLSDDIMTPYVSFSDAVTNSGEYVQIIGKLDKKKSIKTVGKKISFHLTGNKAETLEIEYSDSKPANFEHAEQIVVLGRYNKQDEKFIADKLLVKCPSKYKKRIEK